MKQAIVLAVIAIAAGMFSSSPPAAAQTHTYYVAAEEVVWDYAPSGMNLITGERLKPPPPLIIGNRYKKAVFHEYTDASYQDGVPLSIKGGDSVAPGGTFTYVWEVPERSGPGLGDANSIMWFYHSHVHEVADLSSGLMGAIIISRKGTTKPDGTPIGVDGEFVVSFAIFDENQSNFFKDNMKT